MRHPQHCKYCHNEIQTTLLWSQNYTRKKTVRYIIGVWKLLLNLLFLSYISWLGLERHPQMDGSEALDLHLRQFVPIKGNRDIKTSLPECTSLATGHLKCLGQSRMAPEGHWGGVYTKHYKVYKTLTIQGRGVYDKKRFSNILTRFPPPILNDQSLSYII